jgi:hypothetical protein
MKYSTRIKQTQLIGKIKINPKGGEFQDAELKEIMADPWGKELIRKGMITIEGVKSSDIKDEKKK